MPKVLQLQSKVLDKIFIKIMASACQNLPFDEDFEALWVGIEELVHELTTLFC